MTLGKKEKRKREKEKKGKEKKREKGWWWQRRQGMPLCHYARQACTLSLQPQWCRLLSVIFGCNDNSDDDAKDKELIAQECVVTRQKRSSVNCGISRQGLSDRHPSLERALILTTITTGVFIIAILLQQQTKCLRNVSKMSQKLHIRQSFLAITPLLVSREAKNALSWRALATKTALILSKLAEGRHPD